MAAEPRIETVTSRQMLKNPEAQKSGDEGAAAQPALGPPLSRMPLSRTRRPWSVVWELGIQTGPDGFGSGLAEGDHDQVEEEDSVAACWGALPLLFGVSF